MRDAFTLDISTGNAAFDDEGGGSMTTEIAAILRQVAQRVEDGATGGVLHDSNGNRVGSFQLQRASD